MTGPVRDGAPAAGAPTARASSGTPLLLAGGLALLAVWLGVWSGDGYRWGPALLVTLSGLQGLWTLGAWSAGALLAPRRLGRGAVAGASFGLVAIASYYGWQAVADSTHAATSQLVGGGLFWVVGGVLGGAVAGAAGSLASRPGAAVGGRPSFRWSLATAAGWTSMAVVLACEAVGLVLFANLFYDHGTLVVAAGILSLLAVGLVVGGVRRSGLRAALVALGASLVLVPLAVLGFLALEGAFGYPTI